MYMTISELALHFRVSRGTIQRAVNLGVLPAPIRIGKGLRFLTSAVEEWERKAFAAAQNEPEHVPAGELVTN